MPEKLQISKKLREDVAMAIANLLEEDFIMHPERYDNLSDLSKKRRRLNAKERPQADK